MRNGRALKEVSDIPDTTPFAELRDRISQPDVKIGGLLWQGRLGFYIALTASPRENGPTVDVRCLQVEDGLSHIKASYTVPVRALLNEGLVKTTDRELFADLALHLQEFVDHLAKGYSTWG